MQCRDKQIAASVCSREKGESATALPALVYSVYKIHKVQNGQNGFLCLCRGLFSQNPALPLALQDFTSALTIKGLIPSLGL